MTWMSRTDAAEDDIRRRRALVLLLSLFAAATSALVRPPCPGDCENDAADDGNDNEVVGWRLTFVVAAASGQKSVPDDPHHLRHLRMMPPLTP